MASLRRHQRSNPDSPSASRPRRGIWLPPPVRSWRRRVFWLGLVTLLLLAALWTADEIYRWRSNFILWAYRHSTAVLEVKLADRWKPIAGVSVRELDAALTDLSEQDGFRMAELTVRRRAVNASQRLASFLCEMKVAVMLISPAKTQFSTSFKPKFALTTARERLDSEQALLAITANFRDPQGRPMGWVVHKGKQVNRPFPAWTGVFFVKSGVPWFGPKSLLEEVPGEIQEGTQGYPSVMKNHTVFTYVDQEPDKFFDGRKITYRALAGTRRSGDIVFVVSGDGGVMNVSEVTALAERLQVQHATLLDGGRALQYSTHLQGMGRRHFRAFNTQVDWGPPWMHSQRSPVYIVVNKRAP
jgi:uncharacterized protein YigE (DUF2233 family)